MAFVAIPVVLTPAILGFGIAAYRRSNRQAHQLGESRVELAERFEFSGAAPDS